MKDGFMVGVPSPFSPNAPGLQETHKLPSVEEAIVKFKSLGYATQYVRARAEASRILTGVYVKLSRGQHFIRWFNSIYNFKLSYPLVCGRSDLTIVPHNKIEKFCHYCGIFAGLNLFIEIAIPTTLVLLQEDDSKLMTDKDSRFQTFQGHLGNLHPFDLRLPQNKNINTPDDLLAAFPREYLYIHPIKLSQLSQD